MEFQLNLGVRITSLEQCLHFIIIHRTPENNQFIDSSTEFAFILIPVPDLDRSESRLLIETAIVIKSDCSFCRIVNGRQVRPATLISLYRSAQWGCARICHGVCFRRESLVFAYSLHRKARFNEIILNLDIFS